MGVFKISDVLKAFYSFFKEYLSFVIDINLALSGGHELNAKSNYVWNIARMITNRVGEPRSEPFQRQPEQEPVKEIYKNGSQEPNLVKTPKKEARPFWIQ